MMHLPITQSSPGTPADLAQIAAAFADEYDQGHGDALPMPEAVAEVDHALAADYPG